MPLISIETNQSPENNNTLNHTLKIISSAVADLLGKPEAYVMLKFEHNSSMMFAGNDLPLAHLKLKSLGLDETKTTEFSRQLCKLMETHFEVPPERIYIEFASPERHLWGWDSATF